MSLGQFLVAPQKEPLGNDLRLVYTGGNKCRTNARIRSIIILKCNPGDVESAPVLRSISGDGCIYQFEWKTAAACVLSRVSGDACRVEDANAGTGVFRTRGTQRKSQGNTPGTLGNI